LQTRSRGGEASAGGRVGRRSRLLRLLLPLLLLLLPLLLRLRLRLQLVLRWLRLVLWLGMWLRLRLELVLRWLRLVLLLLLLLLLLLRLPALPLGGPAGGGDALVAVVARLRGVHEDLLVKEAAPAEGLLLPDQLLLHVEVLVDDAEHGYAPVECYEELMLHPLRAQALIRQEQEHHL